MRHRKLNDNYYFSSIIPYSRELSRVQFSWRQFPGTSCYPRNKHDYKVCNIFNGHDRLCPQRLNHENWTLQKFPSIW